MEFEGADWKFQGPCGNDGNNGNYGIGFRALCDSACTSDMASTWRLIRSRSRRNV